MSAGSTGLATAVFLLTLAGTFVAAWMGRRHAKHLEARPLGDQKLNRWLVGLSAGATANSGFVVTGAVSLGYLYGLQWLLLPLAWLLGDVLFWSLFPARINRFGTISRATTLSEIITHGLSDQASKFLALLCSVIVLICIGGYTTAQWIAGEKFLVGAFDVPRIAAGMLFASVIIFYTSMGGFRGSVYADTFQAIIRVIGTIIALTTILWFAMTDRVSFASNITAAGSDFLSVTRGQSLIAIGGFVLGYASAALGFGLGQPQLVSRYLAGSSPAETRAAWWVYIGFVQFTWVAMTFFGVLLRGVMPGIVDSEMGFSLFFQRTMPATVTGIVMADVFATIAATSNSLLVAMSQVATRDLLPRIIRTPRRPQVAIAIFSVIPGIATMVLPFIVNGTVVSFALTSVSLMAASLAPAVMVKVLGWRHTAWSLATGIVLGFVAATAWKYSGLGALVNEAAIGMVVGLLANAALAALVESSIREEGHRESWQE